ncbi:putative Sensor histidine kinase [Candidatus Hydrogenisulfobacillus filiaventi]|uniref:histidine kinase n=1 Tax=Candidatus Hydrogenisulfobacillus filiaventi TaxID=2707344 RepID=A0A6F8ZE56_9FIRM|nr:sensor histidine kinase [Bacillota bacterium]CAB1128286.1 putative Sensor histidine kinase [Candidatus Hydrogenisulfobacillus filiaventi]
MAERPAAPPRDRTWRWLWVWMAYVLFPVASLWQIPLPAARRGLGVALAAGFTLLYGRLLTGGRATRPAIRLAAVVASLGGGFAGALLTGDPDFLSLAVFAGPVAALAPGTGHWLAALGGIVAGEVAAAAVLPLRQPWAAAWWNVIVPTLIVSAGVHGWVRFARTHSALQEAEQALAVDEERLRLSRDLHDGLGHTLTALAYRAEVAALEVRAAVPAAAAEMEQVAGLARQALAELQAVVHDWRPTLEGEWRRGRDLLTAVGVAVEAEGLADPVPPQLETTLAWILREALTNVVRHSRARRCRVRLATAGPQVELEVADDGTGGAGRPWGHGLQGIAERVARWGAGGTVRVDDHGLGGRGFRLQVTLPAPAAQEEGSSR